MDSLGNISALKNLRFRRIRFNMSHCCTRISSLISVMFIVFFVTFQCSALGQVRYLIVSIPDLCFITYLDWEIRIHTAKMSALGGGA